MQALGFFGPHQGRLPRYWPFAQFPSIHLSPLAGIVATGRGFVLEPCGVRRIAVLAPPVEGDHAGLLALLSDGEAWSSSRRG